MSAPPHCKLSSRASVEKKTDHYRIERAKADGVQAAGEPYASMLVPLKYVRDRELEDAWLEGFRSAYLFSRPAAIT